MLTRDAVTKSATLKELYAALAANIDDEDERKAFLKGFDL
jgi:hypothetical protein